MGRRSQHTPEELKELILVAARRIVEDRGLKALSAREIARDIGYAPGTLYNMFDNLDDILLRVEARVLGELDSHLGSAMSGRQGSDAIKAFASAYVEFAYRHPRLWELLQYHHPLIEKKAPDWYLERVYAPMSRLEPVLSRHSGTKDAEAATRNARQMWAAIHGVTLVATTPKFGNVPMPTTISMVESIIAELAGGRSAPQSAPRDHRRTAAE